MSAPVTQFNGVSVRTLANVYFDGNVVSYTILMPEGEKKTLGLIRPGTYHFNTEAPEHMVITDGACRVTIDGRSDSQSYPKGSEFNVPGKSGFNISVDNGLCQYICSFLS